MAEKILKAVRVRAVTTLAGAPAILVAMNAHGVLGAQLGRSQASLPFGVDVDVPLPFANTPYAASAGDLVAAGVWAFPVHGCAAGNPGGSFEPASRQYRKPKFPGRKCCGG